MRTSPYPALIVIDQQKGIDHPKLGPRNNPNAQAQILDMLAVWRENDWPVYHVRHRSQSPDSVFWPDQSGYEFKPEFKPKADEMVITKGVPCAFCGSSLQQSLEESGFDTLVVVGAATNNSVEASARTAGNLGFNVLVVEDACYTFDKADFFGVVRSADEVHAMSLANLQGEYATVVNSSALLTKLLAEEPASAV